MIPGSSAGTVQVCPTYALHASQPATMVALSSGPTRMRLAKGTLKTSAAEAVIAANTSVGEAPEATSVAAFRSASCSAATRCSARLASAFEIVVETSSEKAAIRASAVSGSGSCTRVAATSAPHSFPSTRIGAPTVERTPRSRAN